MRFVFLFLLCLTWGAHAGPVPPQVPTRWTQFVQVDGQPEPVPAQWVSTPEGKLAHSIKLPNPLPKDSGYRKGMTSKVYFDHLCKTEAGEFIYKTVDNVEGFYFARPPQRPTDDDLQERYKLEAPEIERTFQLLEATPRDRGVIFVGRPWKHYLFVEEPAPRVEMGVEYVRSSGYQHDLTPMRTQEISKLRSRYGMTWRGIKRPNDRDLLIAGSEWIVFDLQTKEVLAMQRNFTITGFTRNTQEGIYWPASPSCRQERILPSRLYKFITQSLRPVNGEAK